MLAKPDEIEEPDMVLAVLKGIGREDLAPEGIHAFEAQLGIGKRIEATFIAGQTAFVMKFFFHGH